MDESVIYEENENVALGKPKGPYYKMKLVGKGWLGYKENKEKYLSVVSDEKDAITINKSTKSKLPRKSEFYTWTFYPNGRSKSGLRIDFHTTADVRRIFGSKHDSTAISWAVIDGYFVSTFSVSGIGFRLAVDSDGDLVANSNGTKIELVDAE